MNLDMQVPSILTLNAGSSSLRLASFSWTANTPCAAEDHVSTIPACEPDLLIDYLDRHALPTPDVVVHRVVHGGEKLSDPVEIDSDVEAQIEQHRRIAPLHNGVTLEWIRASRQAFGTDTTQVACFDTGFYQDLPAVASTYALPNALRQQFGLRRYGHHGIAHQSMLNQWRAVSSSDKDRKVISLQLGSGCSITATDQGWPIDTSMGFSPLGGVMMGTRCGDLDPEVVLHLIEQAGLSPGEVRAVLNEQSGLRGVSGKTGDLQTLMNTQTPEATLAIAMFCHQLRAYVGAYFATLGGAHAIVFGGGIGEHAPIIRARALEHLEWAGVRLDHDRNHSTQAGARHIHADDRAVDVWVIPTDEARVMADWVRLPHNIDTASAVTGTRTPL